MESDTKIVTDFLNKLNKITKNKKQKTKNKKTYNING
jgi:hypothetical protein